MSQVRTRFAPSPTGYFHVGGARTALFNWLYARQQNGVFVLRIEDTDQARSTDESIRIILEGMEWLGYDWDEGPFFQSHQIEAHVAAADKLLADGTAYRCYATSEETAAAREVAKAGGNPSWKYRGRGCVISEAEQDRRAAEGLPSVVRFAASETASPVCFTDRVYGEQAIEPREIDDFVLLRTDGTPLYMLSVVIDDIQANINHVIRGQDHLSNTPKQILLYRALGEPEPQFAHLPLIMAASGEKLSKRKHGDVVSITTYRDRGFLPEALTNFLALLGWSPHDGEEREIFRVPELIERFDLTQVNRSNAKFTFDLNDERRWTDPKAQSINAEWIRTMSLDELIPKVKQVMLQEGIWDEAFEGERADWFRTTIDLIRERFWTLRDFVEQGAAYFSDRVEFEDKAVRKNLQKTPELATALPALADRFETLETFDGDAIEVAVRAVADETGLKHGQVINGLRTAVSGQSVGPGAFQLCVAIGRDRVVRRLRVSPVLITGGTP